jgi:hypothetical protein
MGPATMMRGMMGRYLSGRDVGLESLKREWHLTRERSASVTLSFVARREL